MSGVALAGLIVGGLVVIVLLDALRRSVNIVQQGQVGVVKRLGEYRKPTSPAWSFIAPFVDSLQHRRHARDPRPRRSPGGDHQGQRRRARSTRRSSPSRRRQAGAVQRQALRRRDRCPRPHRAALGDRHAVARRGAVGAGADQRRRAAARWRWSPTSGASASAASRSSRSPRRRRSSRHSPCRRQPTRRSGPRSCSPRGYQQSAINVADGDRAKAAINDRPRRARSARRSSCRGQPSGGRSSRPKAGRRRSPRSTRRSRGPPDPSLVAILQLDTLGKFADSDNAKIVVPYESAGLLGAAQTLRGVLGAGSAGPTDGQVA